MVLQSFLLDLVNEKRRRNEGEDLSTHRQEVSQGFVRKLVQLLSMELGDDKAVPSRERSDVEEGVAV